MKPMTEQHLALYRRHMVEIIDMHFDLAGEEIGKEELDPGLRRALMDVPRHLFVPQSLMLMSYQDTPLPIGFDKTISQPIISALMIDLLAPEPHEVVLEIGTGTGYQTAILAELVERVWSVEIVEELASLAEARLQQLGYPTVDIRVGDGSRGWAEHAPYDKILVAAAAEEPPPALLKQLKPGGRMVMPLGGIEAQQLTAIDIDEAGNTHTREVMPVRFSLLETVL